jgi:hypothetical protein
METRGGMEKGRTWRDMETVEIMGQASELGDQRGHEQGRTWRDMETVEITGQGG